MNLSDKKGISLIEEVLKGNQPFYPLPLAGRQKSLVQTRLKLLGSIASKTKSIKNQLNKKNTLKRDWNYSAKASINIVINVNTLKKLNNKKNAFIVYSLLKLLSKHKIYSISSVEFKNVLKMPKSSFYQALKDLIDINLIKLEDQKIYIFREKRTKNSFIITNLTEIIDLSKKITPKEFVLKKYVDFMIKKMSHQESEIVETTINSLLHFKENKFSSYHNCLETCLVKVKKTKKWITFTFNIFKSLELSKKYLHNKLSSYKFWNLFTNLKMNYRYFKQRHFTFYTLHNLEFEINGRLA